MSLDLVTFADSMDRLGHFSPNCHIAVAVSGGPDSMALCHLLHRWLRNYPQARLTALIVDHGLRPESAWEAQITQDRLKKFGINSTVLHWDDDKPATRIQERARQARYALLEGWCGHQGVIHLLTGHHFDDQWETVVSRLQKKSDIIGLRGILPINYKSFGRILRPLLGFTKADILAYLNHHQIDYALDPSNQNLKYLRAQLRHHRHDLEQHDFSSDRIQKVIKEAISMTDSRLQKLAEFVVQYLRIDPLGYFEIDRQPFIHLEQALQIELLRHLSRCMATASYPLPRHKALTAFEKIQNNTRSTLAGWYIVPKKNVLIIGRESRHHHKGPMQFDDLMRQDRFILLANSQSKNRKDLNLPSYLTADLPSHSNFILKFLRPLLP